MNILASELQKRSTVSALMGESITRRAAVSSFISIVRTILAGLCCLVFVFGPLAALAKKSAADEAQEATTFLILTSGSYEGVWRAEDGTSGPLLAELSIDGQSVKGKLTVIGVEDYSGDKIRGKCAPNDDGTLSVEFKTRDGKWKTKAVFDGQMLVGTYMYEYQDRRVQRIVKGEWAAQRASD